MAANDCIFCKIVKKEIPAKIAEEGADWIAFHDIHPKAPLHLLVVPHRHLARLSDAKAEDADFVGRLFLEAARIGRAKSPAGFRLMVNDGSAAGQRVFHIHIHILGQTDME